MTIGGAMCASENPSICGPCVTVRKYISKEVSTKKIELAAISELPSHFNLRSEIKDIQCQI